MKGKNWLLKYNNNKKLRGNIIRSEASFLNNTIKKVEVLEKGVIFNQFGILANCNETLYKNLVSELYDVGLFDKYTDI